MSIAVILLTTPALAQAAPISATATNAAGVFGASYDAGTGAATATFQLDVPASSGQMFLVQFNNKGSEEYGCRTADINSAWSSAMVYPDNPSATFWQFNGFSGWLPAPRAVPVVTISPDRTTITVSMTDPRQVGLTWLCATGITDGVVFNPPMMAPGALVMPTPMPVVTTTTISPASPPKASKLTVSLTTKRQVLLTDPSTSADVVLTIAVSNSDGSPAGAATIHKTRNGKTVRFRANKAGRLRLAERVSAGLSAGVEVTARSHGHTGKKSIRLYSVAQGPVCHVDGKPEKLNALRKLLDLVGVPTIKSTFDGWIQAATSGTHFIPARYATTLRGVKVLGSGVSPLYALRIVVKDRRSHKPVSSSELFSRSRALWDPLKGTGLAPLQAFARRMQCGRLA